MPINKPLSELVKEGYTIIESLPKGLKIYGKDKERMLYDSVNEQILWKCQ